MNKMIEALEKARKETNDAKNTLARAVYAVDKAIADARASVSVPDVVQPEVSKPVAWNDKAVWSDSAKWDDNK